MDFGAGLAGAFPVAAIGTAAQLGGGLMNMQMQRETNNANAELAKDQMSFQENMANTAHQREVKDLQLAGLNPTLSAGGNGSATPSGASATMQAPQLPDMALPQVLIQTAALDQAQQKINIDKANSAAGISKSLSETQLNKMKTILSQKGMIRAELEGQGASLIQKAIDFMKKSYTSPRVPRADDYKAPNPADMQKAYRDSTTQFQMP